MTARGRHLDGCALTLVGTALFSTKAIFIKLAYVERADAVMMLASRMAVSLPFFAAVGIWAWMRRAPSALVRPQAFWAAAATGFLGYYVAMWFDFTGLLYISAQLERLMLFTSIALSAACLAAFAHFILTTGGVTMSAPPRYWMLAAGTGLLASVLPNFLSNAGLARISATANAMIATVSPLITIYLAVLILDEPFGCTEAAGTALVVAGVGYFSFAEARAQSRISRQNTFS